MDYSALTDWQDAAQRARQELARRHLIPFAEYTFAAYRARRVHRFIAEKLEAAARREVRRLMLCIPPQYGKSELASVRFPAWWLGKFPAERIILTCYGAELAQHFSRAVRNLMRAPEYQDIFDIKLSDESHAVQRWDLAEHRGGMVATGVGGGITGRKADLAIIDDPFKDGEEVRSTRARERVHSWFRSVLYTRLDPQAVVVIINTRWHKQDLTGWLLELAESGEGEEWELISLPAVARENDPLGRKVGEPLLLERHDRAALAQIERVSGPRIWRAVWQQDPQEMTGGLFKRENVKVLESAPSGVKWLRYWDFAFTEKEVNRNDPDWTVGTKIGLWQVAEDDVRTVIAHVTDCQHNWPDAKRHIIQAAIVDGKNVQIRGEEVGTQKAAVQDLQTAPELHGYSVRGLPVKGDKVSRAQPFLDRVQAGFVYMVRGAWNVRWLDWLEGFPNAAHDDHMDSATGGYNALTRGKKFLMKGIYA